MTQMTPEWLDWIDTNIARGVPQQTLIDTLSVKGFAPELAAYSVRSRTPGFLVQNPNARPPFQPSPEVQRALAIHGHSDGQAYQHAGMALNIGNVVEIDGHRIGVAARCEKPHVIVFDNVLTGAECEQMIALSRARLEGSTTVDDLTGKAEPHPDRTSEGTFFHLNETPFIASLDARIAALMQLPVAHGEGLQILRYGVGGEYKPHYDYFPPALPGSAVHIAHGGQRIATLIIYLNSVADGGETIFPEINFNVVPVQGRAVYFSYFDRNGNIDPLTYHGGNPVKQGDKWIATKWVREGPYR
jgi:prolyl 4-hydroxylase